MKKNTYLYKYYAVICGHNVKRWCAPFRQKHEGKWKIAKIQTPMESLLSNDEIKISNISNERNGKQLSHTRLCTWSTIHRFITEAKSISNILLFCFKALHILLIHVSKPLRLLFKTKLVMNEEILKYKVQNETLIPWDFKILYFFFIYHDMQEEKS